MKIIRAVSPQARPERYATELLHDESNVRIVGFHLLPGQSIPPHRNASTVALQPIHGTGIFRGETNEYRLGPGQSVVYEPGELHSIEAIDDELRFLAIITPGPMAAKASA